MISDFFGKIAEQVGPGEAEVMTDLVRDSEFDRRRRIDDQDRMSKTYYGDGAVVSGYSMNRTLFPSLAGERDTSAQAKEYMGNLKGSHVMYAKKLSLTDPMAAAVAFADADSMDSEYRKLTSGGWDPLDAAHAIGLSGSLFGSYANAADNAGYLKRHAATRGGSINDSYHELDAVWKGFRAQFLQRYGYQPGATPDASMDETVRDSFSKFLGGMRSVEDKYNWQFDRDTYVDSAKRVASAAAELTLGNATLSDVDPTEVVRSALMSNGSLRDGDPNDNRMTRFMERQAQDRQAISLFEGDDGFDTLVQPNKASKGVPVPMDIGLASRLRQAFSDHRIRGLKHGDVDDFSDTTALKSDFKNAFRMFSTSSAKVSDDTFDLLAGTMIGKVSSGNKASVTGTAAELAKAGVLSDDQADALGQWTRSLTVDSPQGQQRINALATPFVMQYAAGAGLSTRDPLVSEFASGVYRLLKRRYQDHQTVAGLEGIDAMSSQGFGAISQAIEQDLAVFTQSLMGMTKAKNDAAAAKAAAVQAAKE